MYLFVSWFIFVHVCASVWNLHMFLYAHTFTRACSDMYSSISFIIFPSSPLFSSASLHMMFRCRWIRCVTRAQLGGWNRQRPKDENELFDFSYMYVVLLLCDAYSYVCMFVSSICDSMMFRCRRRCLFIFEVSNSEIGHGKNTP